MIQTELMLSCAKILLTLPKQLTLSPKANMIYLFCLGYIHVTFSVHLYFDNAVKCEIELRGNIFHRMVFVPLKTLTLHSLKVLDCVTL